MKNLPEKFLTVNELDELLSRPSEALIKSFRELEGDVMILGAGGKIGPSLARMAQRAVKSAGVKKEIIAVDLAPLAQLEAEDIKTITCDMLELEALRKLPQVENIVYMVGRKFGSAGQEWLTWAINVMVPDQIARVFTKSRMLVFSTGCVYPLVEAKTGGSTETDQPQPIGEYAMSCLGRERVFDYFSAEKGMKVAQIRLNYAVEPRYGVLVDIATKVYQEQPVDVTTGFVNVIWQGDVCERVLRCFLHAGTPSFVLNLTGPETISVRWLAQRFGELFGKQAIITGRENGIGYLSNASKALSMFSEPSVPLDKIIAWTAYWIESGGENLSKPTHFEVQDGQY